MAITHVAQLPTAQTCNCLLPTPPQQLQSNSPGALPFYLACYELLPQRTDNENVSSSTNEACYRGSVHTYSVNTTTTSNDTVSATQPSISSTALRANDTLPGIFDLTWCPLPPQHTSSVANSTATSCSNGPAMALLAACTDGSARLLHPDTLTILDVYTGIHHEMLTSCTPIDTLTVHKNSSFTKSACTGEENKAAYNNNIGRLLCTAHTGAVRLYDTASHQVVRELQSHEYDAWCSATLPTTISSDDNSEVRPRLLSGGDDGYLYLHDLRLPSAHTASWKMRYEAGVVGITPVVSTTHTATSNDNTVTNLTGNMCNAFTETPYLLVGCYDESLSVVDIRQQKRPVAQCTRLGGGVWRTRNTLFPSVPGRRTSYTTIGNSVLHDTFDISSTSPPPLLNTTPLSHAYSNALGYINDKNVLLLPLMQRGGALIAYDITQAEDAVFGTPHYLPLETRPTPTLSDASAPECLIYDMCRVDTLNSNEEGCNSSLVATCSFYEKVVDLWRVDLTHFI